METKFTRVAEVTETTWIDTEATEPGQEYRYKVKAVRDSYVGKPSRKAAVIRGVQTTLTVTPEPLETARSHIDASLVNFTGQITIAGARQRNKAFTGVRLRKNFGYVIEVYETGPEWVVGSLRWSAKIKDDNGVEVKSFSNTNGPGLSVVEDFAIIKTGGPADSDYDIEVKLQQGYFESASIGWPDRLEIEAELRIYTYDDPTDDCVGELETNCDIRSNSSVDGSFHDDYDTDWYRVPLNAGSTYEVRMVPDETEDAAAAAWINGTYNSVGDFLSNDGSIVAGPQTTGLAYHTAAGGVATHDNAAPTIIRAPSSGDYYIALGSYGSAGNREGHYTLTVTGTFPANLDGDDFVPGYLIDGRYREGGAAGNFGLYGAIVPGAVKSGYIEHHKDRDWFTAFGLDAEVQYRAVMRGITLYDAQIGGVYNAAGERVVGPPLDDFDVMLSFDSRLDFTVPTTETYYIEVTASNCKVGKEALDPVTGDLTCTKKNPVSFNNIGQYSLFLRTLPL